MIRFILVAAALAVATPGLVGQPRTLLEVRQHFAQSESGNDKRVFFGGRGITRRAAEIHAAQARQEDHVNGSLAPTVERLLSNANSVVNETAARIFRQLKDEDPTS